MLCPAACRRQMVWKGKWYGGHLLELKGYNLLNVETRPQNILR